MRMPGPLARAFLAGSLAFVATAAPGVVDVSGLVSLDHLDESPWELIRLDEDVPATEYRLVRHGGVVAIEATADASMALLARRVEVDLKQNPVLCWRWWVDAPLRSADLETRAGDDYAARVYVTFDLPSDALTFGTRAKLALARRIYGGDVPDAALNYVWDNSHPVGTQQANAYTDRAWMVVQESGGEKAGRWVDERRDVLADLRESFGSDGDLKLLAVAADTDNTGEQARALFAELHFVARDQRCRFRSLPEDP